jgi:hypothetical protein
MEAATSMTKAARNLVGCRGINQPEQDLLSKGQLEGKYGSDARDYVIRQH